MIPEREREALMRLTMCAREECDMCKYQYDCDYEFQCELATKNMNILADALRKAEPQNERSKQSPLASVTPKEIPTQIHRYRRRKE